MLPLLPALRPLFLALSTAAVAATPSGAAVKVYDSSSLSGAPGDERRVALDLCPPVDLTPGSLEGFSRLLDDGLGTVTLELLEDVSDNLVDVGPDALLTLFGPGAFVFLDVAVTRSAVGPHVSNDSGIGAHGPSSTAPGDSVEWGVVSGWQITGTSYCLSSPAAACNENGFAHAATVPAVLPSLTYDLGTWLFDAEGDYEAADWYIRVTSNGGLSNNQERLRGAFVGESLPVLPPLGLAALVAGLLGVGLRRTAGQQRNGDAGQHDAPAE